MRSSLKVVALAGVFALPSAWSLGRHGGANSQDQTTVVKSSRGGLLAKTEKNQFEVFFYQTGLRIFPLDSAGSPVDVTGLSGTVTFYHPNSPKPWFTRPLLVEPASAAQPQGNLMLAIGLTALPPTGAKATFDIAGLPDSGEYTVVAIVPVVFVPTSKLAPSAAAATANPRYVYGPGYYGFGYYQYPGPQAAPENTRAPTVFSYSMPGRRSSGGTSGVTHDWSTGRDYQSGGLISKPWLRPSD
jgi:hypothetical protein